MASKHNFNLGPMSMYKPTAPSKGSYRTCYNDNEVTVARQDGFTSQSYVRSEWPTTAYHKTSGAARPVGKLEWTDEQNAAAVAALGSDWGLEYVATPEPVAAAAPGAPSGGMDISAILAIGADIALLKNRIEDLEEAAIQAESIRMTQERRIIDLEGTIDELSTPAPVAPAGQAEAPKTPAPAAKPKAVVEAK